MWLTALFVSQLMLPFPPASWWRVICDGEITRRRRTGHIKSTHNTLGIQRGLWVYCQRSGFKCLCSIAFGACGHSINSAKFQIIGEFYLIAICLKLYRVSQMPLTWTASKHNTSKPRTKSPHSPHFAIIHCVRIQIVLFSIRFCGFTFICMCKLWLINALFCYANAISVHTNRIVPNNEHLPRPPPSPPQQSIAPRHKIQYVKHTRDVITWQVMRSVKGVMFAVGLLRRQCFLSASLSWRNDYHVERNSINSQ